MGKPRITISLDPEDYQTLSTVAEKSDRSLSWLASYAIKKFLAKLDTNKQQEFEFQPDRN